MTVVVASFMLFLLIFLGIGILSATRRKNTSDDYLLASRSVSPWVMALSAVATNNSGFMFVGLIGATYIEGLSSLSLMADWVPRDHPGREAPRQRTGELCSFRWAPREAHSPLGLPARSPSSRVRDLHRDPNQIVNHRRSAPRCVDRSCHRLRASS